MRTFHLHITGRVQGVGFRPLVYALANQFWLSGTVSNGNDGVHVFFNSADLDQARHFEAQIIGNTPSRAIVEGTLIEEVSYREFGAFEIIESSPDAPVDGLKVAPDFGLCDECRKELSDPSNRRHGYAFTTCTQCGPRYSVQQSTPYDRPVTSMSSFAMCEHCLAEYEDVNDRRFYSQTNSCGDCGIELACHSKNSKEVITGEETVSKTVDALNAGKIVAAKGIGGYLLMCDASNPNAVSELRMRKNRPNKPFALLYPHADAIKRDCELTEKELQSLRSPEAPIVLLKRKGGVSSIAHELISPGLDSVGVMFPYAPLLELIAQEFGDALIATSANVSGSPILYKDQDALQLLEIIADVVLMNNREIVVPQDDSVVSYSGDRPLLLRRSRGFAPSYFGALPINSKKGWLAMGAHMKGSVAFSCGNIWHISQYLGSLDSFESQTAYKHTLGHLTQLIDFQTKGILTDGHPGYFVNQLAHEYADALEVPLVQIQHHEAHFAAVLQENDLLEGNQQVLGVIWDGTGYGTDGHIWGGEFFTYQNDEIDRITHFGYVANLASDKMAREPRISALAFLSSIPGLEEILKEKFSIEEWRVYQRLIATSNVMTSSVGRLFDAVASIIGLIDQSTYEGQAAMLLEQCAQKCKTKDISGYRIEVSADKVDASSLFIEMLRDLNENVDKATIALKFHIALVELVRSVAHHYDQKHLAFSGGVFQNALLVELIDQRLGHEFELYFHKELSPNDENISFGQLAHYHIQLRSLNNLKTEENYVFSNSR